MASRQYIMRQIATHLKFAKETNDQKVAAALIEKAASLKARVDELEFARRMSNLPLIEQGKKAASAVGSLILHARSG